MDELDSITVTLGRRLDGLSKEPPCVWANQRSTMCRPRDIDSRWTVDRRSPFNLNFSRPTVSVKSTDIPYRWPGFGGMPRMQGEDVIKGCQVPSSECPRNRGSPRCPSPSHLDTGPCTLGLILRRELNPRCAMIIKISCRVLV